MNATARRRLVAAGALLGMSLGGFFDGILLHQILQWHHLLSGWTPVVDLVSIKYNMVWDGLFHAFTWIMSVAGLALLWQAGLRHGRTWPARPFAGSLLLGWGLFNGVEGLIDHQILGAHHVHPGEQQLVWDLGFLASGLLLLVIGLVLLRPVAARDQPGRPLTVRPLALEGHQG